MTAETISVSDGFVVGPTFTALRLDPLIAEPHPQCFGVGWHNRPDRTEERRENSDGAADCVPLLERQPAYGKETNDVAMKNTAPMSQSHHIISHFFQ